LVLRLTIGLLLAIATTISLEPAAFSQARFKNPTHPTLSEVLDSPQSHQTRFKVRIENISAPEAFTASDGTHWALDFSPGVWLISDNPNPLFSVGQADLAQSLQAIAEDGNPTALAQSLKSQAKMQSSGIFNTAVKTTKMGGIRPGQVFELTVMASPGQRLSLATMFGQSNDWFYALANGSIALFDRNRQPVSGDVTAQLRLPLACPRCLTMRARSCPTAGSTVSSRVN
jgi:hypothetical protein